MPAIYDEAGISFQYPENWLLDQQALDGGREISVSSPGGAFWSLSIYSPMASLPDLLSTVLGVLRQEYDDLEAEPVNDRIAKQKMNGFDVNFYCLDLTSTAAIRGYQTAEATYLLLWQAEDREFEQIEPIFTAITHSLLAG